MTATTEDRAARHVGLVLGSFFLGMIALLIVLGLKMGHTDVPAPAPVERHVSIMCHVSASDLHPLPTDDGTTMAFSAPGHPRITVLYDRSWGFEGGPVYC